MSHVTRTESRTDSASTTCPPGLLELLEKDELDWDNLRHREAYLRAWLTGSVPRFTPGESAHE